MEVLAAARHVLHDLRERRVQNMKRTDEESHIRVKRSWLRAKAGLSYQSMARGLVSTMVASLQSPETRKFLPPFELLLIDDRGAVLFNCHVGRDGKVQPTAPVRKVCLSDFPANVLLTDRSHVTRTFRIERAANG
jgi:hypothetical protein